MGQSLGFDCCSLPQVRHLYLTNPYKCQVLGNMSSFEWKGKGGSDLCYNQVQCSSRMETLFEVGGKTGVRAAGTEIQM